MGYHKKEIKKGVLGEFSKIREEFEEALDALEQDNKVMLLLELSDLIGAIEVYCESKHSISLENLINMKNATKSAFEDGTRSKPIPPPSQLIKEGENPEKMKKDLVD